MCALKTLPTITATSRLLTLGCLHRWSGKHKDVQEPLTARVDVRCFLRSPVPFFEGTCAEFEVTQDSCWFRHLVLLFHT